MNKYLLYRSPIPPNHQVIFMIILRIAVQMSDKLVFTQASANVLGYHQPMLWHISFFISHTAVFVWARNPNICPAATITTD